MNSTYTQTESHLITCAGGTVGKISASYEKQGAIELIKHR